MCTSTGLGSGSAPARPAKGKNGVMGKAGTFSKLAIDLKLWTSG